MPMRDSTTAVASVALIVLGLFAPALLIRDAADAKKDRATYETVHGISAERYVARNYLFAAASALAVIVGVLRFVDRSRRRLWGMLCLVSIGLAVIGIGGAYARWVAIGFDR